MKHVAIYARVSTSAQDTASQEPDLERWADAQDMPVKWYREKASGTKMDRPVWSELEAAMRVGKVSAIVVWRIDRLGRTASGLTALFDDLQHRKINLVSIRDGLDLSTPAGRLMANMLASVAQFETEVRSERVKAGIQKARAKGKKWGGSIKGVHKKVTPTQIRMIRSLHSEGTAIAAIDLEDAVIRHLFDTLGNPAAAERAIDAAIPNQDKLKELEARLARQSAALEKIRSADKRWRRLYAEGDIELDEYEQETARTRKRRLELETEVATLLAGLRSRPSPESKRDASKQAGEIVRLAGQGWKDEAKRRRLAERILREAIEDTINHDFARMTFDDQRKLVEMVFAGKTSEGKRMGVYVQPIERGKWSFTMWGLLSRTWNRGQRKFEINEDQISSVAPLRPGIFDHELPPEAHLLDCDYCDPADEGGNDDKCGGAHEAKGRPKNHDTRRSKETRPVGTHSTTKMLPSLS